MAYLLESDGYAKHVQGFIDSCQINIKILTNIKLKLLEISSKKLYYGISLKSAFVTIKTHCEFLTYLTQEYKIIKEMREFWRKNIIATTIHVTSNPVSTNTFSIDNLSESTTKYSLTVELFLEKSDTHINELVSAYNTLNQYLLQNDNNFHHSSGKISSVISIVESYIVKFESFLNCATRLKYKNEVWRTSAILETQQHIIDIAKTGFVRNPTTDVSLHDAKWPSDSSTYVHKS